MFSQPKSFIPQSEKLSQPQLSKAEQQKHIFEEISQINVLREQMLHEAHDFTHQLDQLESSLVKKANELQILTSNQMGEISSKNLALVQEFVNYQEHFINKLEGKYSNWEKFGMDLNQVQVKLDSIMSKNELVPKLALIEILETDVEDLINEVEELKKLKDKKRS